MNYDAILFDLDGTLIDTAADFVITVKRLCDMHQVTPPNDADIRNNVSNGAGALVKLALGTRKGDAQFEAHRQQLLDIYEEELGNYAPVFPELQSTLNKLQSEQLPWAIITNKPRKYTELLLERIGLDCPVVLCPCDLNKAKPDPEGILLACKKLDVDPSKCVYLGDHERDIEAGRAAGMATVTCAWGYIADSENIENWGADFVANSTKDAHEILLG